MCCYFVSLGDVVVVVIAMKALQVRVGYGYASVDLPQHLGGRCPAPLPRPTPTSLHPAAEVSGLGLGDNGDRALASDLYTCVVKFLTFCPRTLLCSHTSKLYDPGELCR